MMVTTGHESAENIVKILVHVFIRYSELHVKHTEVLSISNKPQDNNFSFTI